MIMEGREKIFDAEDMPSVHLGELSQSSGLISLPSANRLEDVSLPSDITDSEVEDAATVLTSSACGDLGNRNDRQHDKDVKVPRSFTTKSSTLPWPQRLTDSLNKKSILVDRQTEVPRIITKGRVWHDGSVSDQSLKGFCSDMNVTGGDGVTDMPAVSLDDVRAALQQHCNLLSDRHLLKDLFKSLDDEIEQEPVAGISVQPYCSGKKHMITKDQKDASDNRWQEEQLDFNQSVKSSLKGQSNNCVLNDDFKLRNHVGGGESFVNSQMLSDSPRTCGILQENLHAVMFNSCLVEKEALQLQPSKLAAHTGFERHVKFQSSTNSTQDPQVQCEGIECGDKEALQCDDQQSLEVLKKLARLRWGLMGWEDISSTPPTDTSSSLNFLNHLFTSFQTLQLENKHLKEELTETSRKFKDLSKEFNSKQHQYEKREARLVEADRQLGQLQQAWAAAQEAGQDKAAKLRAHCHVLKQENAFLKKESQCLRNNVTELKAMTQELSLMKTQMLETEELLATSKKRTVELLEENKRVNLCLEQNKKYLRELEEQVKAPPVLSELVDVKARVRGLQDSNRQLSEAKAHLEEELHMLQEQHKLLLKKIVEEQEKRAETEHEKSVLEGEVKGLSGKMSAMKTQLCLHYQAQMEELVAKKSEALQEQLKTLESHLEKNVQEQLIVQKETHQADCEKLKERYEKEIRNIQLSNERQLERLHCETKELKAENHRLHQQRQGVVAAVSCIMGLEQQTSGGPSGGVSLADPGSSTPAGGSSTALSEVKDGSVKTDGHSTSGKNDGSHPHHSFLSSQSSDSKSAVLPEETVTHLDGHSQGALHVNVMSQNGHHKNQKKNLGSSSNRDMNPKLRVCGEHESQTKAGDPQAPLITCCAHSGIESPSKSRNAGLKLNPYQSCIKLFPRKIRRASEILQASDFTDEDISYQDGQDIIFSPREDEEMTGILRD